MENKKAEMSTAVLVSIILIAIVLVLMVLFITGFFGDVSNTLLNSLRAAMGLSESASEAAKQSVNI